MKHKRSADALVVIGGYHVVKALVLAAIAFGAISLFHKDVSTHVTWWFEAIRVDPANPYAGAVVDKAQDIHTHQLKQVSALTSVYAVLFFVQGIGLLLRKRWAEWLTLVALSLLVPIEIYELVRQFSVIRVLVLISNLAIIGYVIWLMRQKK